MLKKFRKQLGLDAELDEFLDNKGASTKYYLEKSYLTNKIFRYLLLLRMKGVNLNALFDEEISTNFKDYKQWKKQSK